MISTGKQNQSNTTIELEATEWFALLQSDSVSEDTLSAFDDWLALSSLHREAYLEAEIIADTITTLSNTVEGQKLKESVVSDSYEKGRAHLEAGFKKEGFRNLIAKLASPRTAYVGAFLLALMILSTIFLVNKKPVQNEFRAIEQHFTSVRGDVQIIKLRDGTSITLGAESEILVTLLKDKRKVTLIHGEAFFDVAKIIQRPFYVDAGELSVKVLGTQFDVRKHPSNTSVSVADGVVEVFAGSLSIAATNQQKEPVTQFDERMTLVAGQQANIADDQALQRNSALELKDVADWRNGRLVYNNSEVQDVLFDANRYTSKGKILIEGSQQISHKKITLSLKVSEIKDLPKMLASILPVDIKKSAGNTILVQK